MKNLIIAACIIVLAVASLFYNDADVTTSDSRALVYLEALKSASNEKLVENGWYLFSATSKTYEPITQESMKLIVQRHKEYDVLLSRDTMTFKKGKKEEKFSVTVILFRPPRTIDVRKKMI